MGRERILIIFYELLTCVFTWLLYWSLTKNYFKTNKMMKNIFGLFSCIGPLYHGKRSEVLRMKIDTWLEAW